MAAHEVPQDGTTHTLTAECPCQPDMQRGPRVDGSTGAVYVHRDQDPDDDGRDPDCGHMIVDVGGEQQHHQIPDDGMPHAPTSECGCGPQRATAGGHVVYVHADPDGDADAALWAGSDQDGGTP